MQKKKKLNLSTKILLFMLLGALLGLISNKEISILPYKYYEILETYIFSPIGKMFINSIKMLVVPMVFVSLVNGVAQIGDLKKLGRVGVKTISIYIITTAIAITIGLILALLIKPGSNSTLSIANLNFKAQNSIPFIDIIVNMIPTNPLKSMTEDNMLQIIVFSILLGVSLTSINKDKSKTILNFFDALNDCILKIIEFIMKTAPVGVFCLIAKVIATLGLSSIINLALYMLTILLALFLHLTLVYTGILTFIAKLNPIIFFKKFWSVMTLAFSTSSSNATLPVNMDVVEKKLGVSKSILGFTLPLGATINMDGTAIMQGVATIFIAQLFNINISLSQLVTVVLTATLASIGTAGVPGVGMITLSMVLQSIGLPVEGIAMIIGVDRILDMCRTVVNITGDAIVTLCVAKSENELDAEIFYKTEETQLNFSE
ncbi:dicarboxylate/amino acid:cation symporter [Haloimpatiens massiliensis]|uniref:dicarboxylate/amino acid:cation symporter n=1 Tax=Haloimpatiens massiliensis TaxID=1658110 RepID=UPI000C854765|nr:dicarboxylate/amino acid:cation symporter [Haloimpatiens massiliensis]